MYGMTEQRQITSFLWQLGKIETLVDKSIKLHFVTQEMQGEEIVELLNYRGMMVYVIVWEDSINEIPRKLGEKLKKQMASTGYGTPSQQMRKALYISRNSNDDIKRAMTAEEYYIMKMEEFTKHIYEQVDKRAKEKEA